MEERKEKNAPWLSVPQFGDWDQKSELPDYSMDFSKIREMMKQNKRDVSKQVLALKKTSLMQQLLMQLTVMITITMRATTTTTLLKLNTKPYNGRRVHVAQNDIGSKGEDGRSLKRQKSEWLRN